MSRFLLWTVILACLALLGIFLVSYIGTQPGGPQFIANQDIPAGTRLDEPEKLFGLFVTGGGPFRTLEEIRGRVILRPIKKGEMIKPEHFEPD